jgi:hypothetical protein
VLENITVLFAVILAALCTAGQIACESTPNRLANKSIISQCFPTASHDTIKDNSTIIHIVYADTRYRSSISGEDRVKSNGK